LVHGSPVLLQVFIRNNGIAATSQYVVEISISNTGFGIIADTTLTVWSSLEAGETEKINYTFAAIPGGFHKIAAEIEWAIDENAANDTTVCDLAVGYRPGTAVINEIMFAPPTGQGEWFEIFNNSDSVVDLNRWGFHDALGKSMVLADTFIVLNAGEFAVVAAQMDFRLDYPDFQGLLIVPETYPTLNNTSDSLLLYDATGQVIDSVYYKENWGGGTEVSLERRDPNLSAVNANNWSGCSQTATPGFANSVLKLDDDLAIESFQIADTLSATGLSAGFIVTVYNHGRQVASGFAINVYADRNLDNAGSQSELCWSRTIYADLEPDSGMSVLGAVTAEQSGHSRYLVELAWSLDEDSSDNYSVATLVVAFPAGCLTLNEFLAYPVNNQVEFIECINISDTILDLSGWSLGNRNSITSLPTTEVPAGDYVVFSSDSAYYNYFKPTSANIVILKKWPGLNYTSDLIWLHDLTGKTIDSLRYETGWPLKAGYSAEKILPELASSAAESWSLAVNSDHQTAGYLNSVTRPEYDLSLDSLKLPTITGDTNTIFEAHYFISNQGRNKTGDASLKIGLANSSIAEFITDISLNGIETQQADSGVFTLGPLASGKYDLSAKIVWAADQVPDNDSISRTLQIAWPEGALLLSEFMPFPAEIRTTTSSVAEYLEIYNPAEKEIDLTDWQFSDQNTAVRRKIPEGFAIPAHQYWVISDDSSVLNFTDLLPEQTFITDEFPSLNNAEDALYIYDPTGRVIDSLLYNSVWGISPEISMERISFENSNRATNWRTCVDAMGGTPGRKNSVAISTPLVKNGIKTTLEVFSPDGDGVNDDIGIRYRLPFPSAKLTLEIYDLTGRLIYRPVRNLVTSAEGVIYWNGDSNYEKKARVGIYIVRCLAADLGSAKSVEYITTLVLAR